MATAQQQTMTQADMNEMRRLRAENERLKQQQQQMTRQPAQPAQQQQQQQQPMTTTTAQQPQQQRWWGRERQPLAQQQPLTTTQQLVPSLYRPVSRLRPLLAARDLFGLPMETTLSQELDEAFDGLGFFGGLASPFLFQGTFSMGGPFMDDSGKYISLVQRRVEQLLEPEMGAGVRCQDPTQQSFASTNIDGEVKRTVGLYCPVSAPGGMGGDVQVRATVDDNDIVTITELQLNKRLPTTTVV